MAALLHESLGVVGRVAAEAVEAYLRDPEKCEAKRSWGGGRGGEEGAGEEESLAFRGFSPTARCTHNAVSFVRISQPRIVHSPGGCEKHCARRSNHALPATVRQQQASSTAHGPREWRDMLTASSEVSLPS